MKIGIIAGSFHKERVERMVAQAKATAAAEGLEVADEVWVPGCFEKPLAAKRMLERGEVDALVVLGIIERGETKHGLVMGQAMTQGLINLQLEHGKPIGFGVLGPEILDDQIEPRLLPYAQAAVEAAKTMLSQ